MNRLYYWFRFTIRLFKGDDHARFRLAEKIFNIIYPDYFIGEWGKIYLQNKVFYKYYCKYDDVNFRSYERKYFLQQLIKLTKNIKGDTVELGVYFGASSELILQAIGQTEKKHHMFDSWQGISQPDLEDGTYWEKGSLNSSLFFCKNNLSAFKENIKIFYEGWIPDTFQNISDDLSISFVHFDLDLHQPTKDGLCFFYDKLSSGGIMLFDDYTFTSCPGVKKAVDDFFADKEEEVIETPFSAFIIKV